VWAAKKLKRGELWMGKRCVDSYLKSQLLSMTYCHAHALHGLDYETWHDGRFLEEWAEDWIVDGLTSCYAHYNKDDVWRALLATMELFHAVAIEVAQKLGYAYPQEAEKATTAWVMAMMNG